MPSGNLATGVLHFRSHLGCVVICNTNTHLALVSMKARLANTLAFDALPLVLT